MVWTLEVISRRWSLRRAEYHGARALFEFIDQNPEVSLPACPALREATRAAGAVYAAQPVEDVIVPDSQWTSELGASIVPLVCLEHEAGELLPLGSRVESR